jgi:Ice-binding-like
MYDTSTGSLALIAAAVADMQTAVTCANGRSCDINYGAIDLGGSSLGPGVYCATGAINITGILSLNAPGVYIFSTLGTLDTAANAVVQFTGTATAANASVFWVPVGATTIGANSTFIGTVMTSSAAITVSAVSALAPGRALSGSAVTVNTSTIARP